LPTYRYVMCDVFTDRPLTGNQLAVFSDAAGIPEDLLGPLAREIHFSETTFVYPPRDPGADLRVRIFTPATEMPFAGHPVLGTAVVVGQTRGLERVALETGAGVVPVTLGRTSAGGSGRMAQPLPTVEPFAAEAELLRGLGVKRSALPVELYTNGPRHVYVALESEQEVAGLAPDLGALARLGPMTINCFAGSGARWKTRAFAPAKGVFEDPATGSAAGPLAVHLARHGRVPFGQEIEIAQGAEIGRPSRLVAVARGSRERLTAVEVAGDAVIVGRGEFTLG
jgi:trans-2,3-dihydro-3-hydroxyanthranilate isomerase